MKKSHDHTHLTRLAAISLVVVMCLSALPMLAQPASALAVMGGTLTGVGAWGHNQAESDGWLEIYNYDAERDITPILTLYTSQSSDQVRMTTRYDGAEHGNVMRIDANGTEPVTTWCTGYTGHTLTDVPIRFSYDFKIVSGTKGIVAVDGQISRKHIGVMPNGTIGMVGYEDMGMGVWHSFEAHYDPITNSVDEYIDGTYRKTVDVYRAGPYTQFSINVNTMEANESLVVELDNIALSIRSTAVQPLPSADGATTMSLIFDDGKDSVYTNRHILGDIPAAVAVITDYVGKTISTPLGNRTYMTWDQIAELNANGWEIMGHGVTHNSLTNMSLEDALAEFRGAKSQIRDNIGLDVAGWVYPHNEYSADTDQIGWNYYEYLSHTTRDLGRWDYMEGTNYFPRVQSTILYSKYAHVNIYTHGVADEPNIWDISGQDLQELVNWIKDNDINVVTPYDGYIPYRNAAMAQVSGNATEFSISYGREFHNYTNDDVLIRISGHDDGKYVIIDEWGTAKHATSAGGMMIVPLGVGSYTVMTLSDYRQAQVEGAMSPLYAAIPVVLVLAVLGGLFTMVGRVRY